VLREDVLAELVSCVVESQPNSKTPHLLITGGRGMGKTTLLRRLALYIEQHPKLAREFVPLSFSEEPYAIGDLADWLLVALQRLTGTLGFSESTNYSSTGAPAAEAHRKDLAILLYRRLITTCATVGKRPLLLCDNFDMLLAQLGLSEQRLLCKLLRSDPGPVLLGGALVVSREAERASPLLRLFRIRPLMPLTVEEHLRLLEKLGTLDDFPTGSAELAERIEHARRFYPLTGGNPRITAVLYRVLSATATQAFDLRRDLELLLDELTPLYKAQIDQLSPQQRRICDALARAWEPLSITELSSQLRLASNTVTSQLGRLRVQGYVVTRSSETGERLCYALAERLFNIFWLMRGSGEAHCNLRWLALFLQSFFSQDHLGEAALQLRGSWGHGLEPLATNAAPAGQFVYLASLTSALVDPRQQLAALFAALALAERIPEAARLNAVSAPLDELLSTLVLPLNNGVELDAIQSALERLVAAYPVQARAWFLLARVRTMQGEVSAAVAAVRRCIELAPTWTAAHLMLARLLDRQGAIADASAAAELAIRCEPESAEAWSLFAHIQHFCFGHDISPSVDAFARAAKLEPGNGSRWRTFAAALLECSRFGEAMDAVRRAVQVEPQNPLNWAVLAVLSFIGGMGSKSSAVTTAGESRREPWFLVRALYYRWFDLLGAPPSGGLVRASLRSVVERPWRHWAAVYSPNWLLRDIEGLLVQELLHDPDDQLLRWSLALIFGRQEKWPQCFREARIVLQTANFELLHAYQNIVCALFLLAGSCGQEAEAAQLLATSPALLQRWPAFMAALEQRAAGRSDILPGLPPALRATAEVFIQCMNQIDTLHQGSTFNSA
jgi:cytochrome c-type biogenesis protein CcmH/NrfG